MCSWSHQQPIPVGKMQQGEGSPAELGPGAAGACPGSAAYRLRRSLCASAPQEGAASVACSSSETGRREGEDFTHTILSKSLKIRFMPAKHNPFWFSQTILIWEIEVLPSYLTVGSVFSEVRCEELVKRSFLNSSSSSLLKGTLPCPGRVAALEAIPGLSEHPGEMAGSCRIAPCACHSLRIPHSKPVARSRWREHKHAGIQTAPSAFEGTIRNTFPDRKRRAEGTPPSRAARGAGPGCRPALTPARAPPPTARRERAARPHPAVALRSSASLQPRRPPRLR